MSLPHWGPPIRRSISQQRMRVAILIYATAWNSIDLMVIEHEDRTIIYCWFGKYRGEM